MTTLNHERDKNAITNVFDFSSPITAVISIAERLKFAREKLGLRQEEVAARAGVSQGTIGNIESGLRKNPRELLAIAEAVGVTPEWLKNGKVNMPAAELPSVSLGPDIKGTVPLLSPVQAGMYKEHIDNFHPGDGGLEMIPTTVPIGPHTFALRVTGDSMEPRFPDGVILIVEPDLDPQHGDFVIAKNGGNETTFKQLVRDGGDWYLKPLNDRYPIKPLMGSNVIGVVRAVEMRLR